MMITLRNIAVALAAVAALAVISVFPACGSSATNTPAPTATPPGAATSTPAPGGNSITIDLVSQNLAFDKKTITVPAGSTVTVNFNNKDSGIPHNLAVYTDSSASRSIFVGQIISSAATVTYTFTAPTAPGTYFFRCDVHPTQMTGSFVVTP